jgi:release factor glutamine methyltransferase
VHELRVVADRSSIVANSQPADDPVGTVLGRLAREVGRQDSAREAREVLSLLWDVSPAWLRANRDAPVPAAVRTAAVAAARRRAAGAPIQYAAGRAAFRNLVLDVDERVLIPRPETELVVEEALRLCRSGVAIDVGTGSGAIALALATEGAFKRILATDVSSDALSVAAANVARLDVRGVVELHHCAALDCVGDIRADLIVSNPPYVSAAEMTRLPRAVRDWEPPVALLSSRNGLDHTFRIVAQAASGLVAGGWLVLETDSTRAAAVANHIQSNPAFTAVRVRQDLTGRDRIVVARRSAAATGEKSL